MGNSLLEHLRRVVGRNFGLHHLWQDGQHVASFSPEGMAPQPPAELWNRVEAAEVRKNARVAREVLVACAPSCHRPNVGSLPRASHRHWPTATAQPERWPSTRPTGRATSATTTRTSS